MSHAQLENSALEPEIQTALRSGQRWLVWVSEDELHCTQALHAIAQAQGLELRRWSLDQDPNAYLSFEQALDQVLSQTPNHSSSQLRELWVWQDFEPPAALKARLQRKLRVIAQKPTGIACVFLQYQDAKPPHPPERFALFRPSPSVQDLIAHIATRCVQGDLGLETQAADQIFAQRESLAQRCVGLEYWQVDTALKRAAITTQSQEQRRILQDYKAAALNADHRVELCEGIDASQLGGLQGYKDWLGQQKLAMSEQARGAGVRQPRGALLVGVPGCGKSLAARVTAHQLGLPLYRLDLGRLFTGVLGGSEARMRQTLRLCERLAPAVLWIDEIEKGLSAGSGHSDGGTAQRSLATLMTWLQEHRHPVFLIATANRIEALPPELTRRGRMDETFFVDLPDAQERRAILEVYDVQSWPKDPANQALAIEQSKGFSGAELCHAVSQARLQALEASREVRWSDLVQALAQTVPLSKARPAELAALRAWGQSHARNAKGTALDPQGDPA